MDERQICRGFRDPYYWLTSTEDYIATVLWTYPDIVVERFVAITAEDSGVLELTELQRATGWQSRAGIAYSPRIQSVSEIPHQGEVPGSLLYNELYIFNVPCDLGKRSQGNLFEAAFAPAPGRTVVFVNQLAFNLSNPDPNVQCLTDLFWLQLDLLQPESYIADGGDCVTFVSRNPRLVDRLEEQLSKLPLNP